MAKVCARSAGEPLRSLSLPRKSVVRLADHPDMTVDVYHGRKTTTTIGCLSQTASYGSVANSAKCEQTASEPEYVSQQC